LGKLEKMAVVFSCSYVIGAGRLLVFF